MSNPKKLYIITFVLVFLTLLSGSALASDVLKLSLSDIRLEKNERIAAFEITINSGRTESLPSLPMGWHLVIDNDPSWTTSIQGVAIVGAAFINSDAALLKYFLSIEVLKDDDISKEIPFDVKATIHVYNVTNEQERTIVVTKDRLIKKSD